MPESLYKILNAVIKHSFEESAIRSKKSRWFYCLHRADDDRILKTIVALFFLVAQYCTSHKLSVKVKLAENRALPENIPQANSL